MCFSRQLHDPGRRVLPLRSQHRVESEHSTGLARRLTLRSHNSSGERGRWAQVGVSVKETEVTFAKFGPAEERSMEVCSLPVPKIRREVILRAEIKKGGRYLG